MFTKSKSERGRWMLKHFNKYNGSTGRWLYCTKTPLRHILCVTEDVNINGFEIRKVWPLAVLFLNAISVINMLINNNLLIPIINNKVDSRYLYLKAITFITLVRHIFQNAFLTFISTFKKNVYHSSGQVAGPDQGHEPVLGISWWLSHLSLILKHKRQVGRRRNY